MIAVVRQELISLMGEANDELNLAAQPPVVILVVGLQGVGKTTTVGKLANLLKQRHRKNVLVASTDLYRPAAVEQLRLLSIAVDARFFTGGETRNPVEIAPVRWPKHAKPRPTWC